MVYDLWSMMIMIIYDDLWLSMIYELWWSMIYCDLWWSLMIYDLWWSMIYDYLDVWWSMIYDDLWPTIYDDLWSTIYDDLWSMMNMIIYDDLCSMIYEVAVSPSYHTVPNNNAQKPCPPHQQDIIAYVVKISVLRSWRWANFARNMLSWSWRSIKLLLLHLVGVPYYFTYNDDARSNTNQVYKTVLKTIWTFFYSQLVINNQSTRYSMSWCAGWLTIVVRSPPARRSLSWIQSLLIDLLLLVNEVSILRLYLLTTQTMVTTGILPLREKFPW
jgi:hypothetical protein